LICPSQSASEGGHTTSSSVVFWISPSLRLRTHAVTASKPGTPTTTRLRATLELPPEYKLHAPVGVAISRGIFEYVSVIRDQRYPLEFPDEAVRVLPIRALLKCSAADKGCVVGLDLPRRATKAK
jgi:hypothetical protein